MARLMSAKQAGASLRTMRAIAICAAVLTAGVALAVRPQSAAANAANAANAAKGSDCHHVHGPFRSKGGNIVTRHGYRFTPYGVNVTRLRRAHGSYDTAVSAQLAEEDAAAGAWCANLVRLTAVQEKLIVHHRVNHAYLSAIETSVRHAEHDGLAVALTLDQTASYNPRLPVRRTLQAWQDLTYHYRHDPQVIFDIFNEPTGPWSLWRNGGSSGGRRYYGMEHLARMIRSEGGRNLLWAEGRNRASLLTGIPRWRLSGVDPLAYSEHRPRGWHTATSWTDSFGFLRIRYRYPVVEGEWANYSRAPGTWGCWRNAPVTVPRFLHYLAKHGIGLVAYALTRPKLLESDSLTDPNHIRSNWSCKKRLNEGAGQQIMTWLARRNGGSLPAVATALRSRLAVMTRVI